MLSLLSGKQLLPNYLMRCECVRSKV